ncbi:uncharacterized protein EI97DRAFT_483380 [Westerdykella ornata]|uniref:MATH domain-containing protein n=1 Tax=Westerdykella ornata TaxID=318751 RepID=A0A6A6J8I9_WESOR|nr:uncharacterized protein EI97DRAFT_483380 [Westerdykella ornata]KAF2272742.1 hypothetical protein EI97DRAFT_483380 [Westerdykella ornata]
MSVTTSAAAIDPPSLLFGQPSPSPPSFSSPVHSPTDASDTATPSASPPEAPRDIEMSTSTTFALPDGQNHDREEDAFMHDLDAPSHVHTGSGADAAPAPPDSTIAVHVTAVDEDAMDITPDTSQASVLPDGLPDPRPRPSLEPPSELDATTMGGQGTTGNGEGSLPPADVALRAPPIEPPQIDLSSQPPPPPPPDMTRSESESSDEEDDDSDQPWHPLHEDTSSPDEDELKEIEARGEVSALDHDHWERLAYNDDAIKDPEYTPGPTGRIEWAIDNYNGTRENPNKELVMKSSPVNIGGHEWQIKFYPKGNDSDYLSIYVECITMQGNQDKLDEQENGQTGSNEGDSSIIAEGNGSAQPLESAELQPAPLPLIDSAFAPRRKGVAAQIAVVLYNPSEPRVNYFRTSTHHFCSASPDWGWTRFHGPYYDIPHRVHGQRQALLRNDKLAFTAYIRLVDDSTGCLWEHPSSSNPWDSFAMTGLQGLRSPSSTSHGGNLISAIATWTHFKPFRQFLYSVIKDGYSEMTLQSRPRVLVNALIEILCDLRTPPKPGSGPVSLEPVLEALEFHGIWESALKGMDVMEIWETLRLKLEEELHSSPHAHLLDTLFGPKKDHCLQVPNYRIPVVNSPSIQAGIDSAPDFAHSSQPLPQLLTVELARQDFDLGSRSYVKLLNKVSLDEHITVHQVPYTLLGFIVHKQGLQSYLYQPILRPGGPGTKWYTYTDGKEENMVKCLTKRQALDEHEGRSGTGKVTGNDAVAYIALYVRDDMEQPAFTSQTDPEPWPETTNPSPDQDATPATVDLVAIDSKAFMQHEGPGILDLFNSSWKSSDTDYVYSVRISAEDDYEGICEKLVAVIPGVEDARQIKFWFIDPLSGTFARPRFLDFGTGSSDLGSKARTKLAWVHVTDLNDLPKEEKASPPVHQDGMGPQVSVDAPEGFIRSPSPLPSSSPLQASSNDQASGTTAAPSVVEPPPLSGDSPMSDYEEHHNTAVQTTADRGDEAVTDASMGEAEVEVSIVGTPNIDPPAVDVVISTSAAPVADTEMDVTQDTIPPPPHPSMWADPGTEPASAAPPAMKEADTTETPTSGLLFIKLFDAETQTLQPHSYHLVPHAEKVKEFVLRKLNFPPDQKIELLQEGGCYNHHLQQILAADTWADIEVAHVGVVIVNTPPSAQKREELAARAALADVEDYFTNRLYARNFSNRLNGHFIFDYFSSQYYKGEVKNGHRHGHGMLIYHDGATYEGSFRLHQRHGHGLYTFQNGDTYDGDWVADQQHGSGTFVEASTGNTYVGGWKNNKKYGEGVTHWKSAQETERLCRICWEDEAEAAFYDCGHVVACMEKIKTDGDDLVQCGEFRIHGIWWGVVSFFSGAWFGVIDRRGSVMSQYSVHACRNRHEPTCVSLDKRQHLWFRRSESSIRSPAIPTTPIGVKADAEDDAPHAHTLGPITLPARVSPLFSMCSPNTCHLICACSVIVSYIPDKGWLGHAARIACCTLDGAP